MKKASPEKRWTAARDRALSDLRTIGPGERNRAVFDAACWLGRFRRFPDFNRAEVVATVAGIGVALGLPEKESKSTAARGVKIGGTNPLNPDDGEDDSAPPMTETFADLCRRKGLDPVRTSERWNITETERDHLPAIVYPVEGAPDRIRILTVPKAIPKWDRYNVQPAILYPPPTAGDRPLYLLNGESAVWACEAAGVDACCTCMGEGALKPEHVTELVATGREIIIPADNDPTGHRFARAAAADLIAAGARARAVRVDIDKPGADVGDMYIARPKSLAIDLAHLPPLDDDAEPAAKEEQEQPRVNRIFRDAQVPQKLKVPKGYDLNAGGVWRIGKDKKSEPVTGAPLLITDILADEETGQHYVELYYRTPRNTTWHTLTIPRDQAMVARKAVELSALGVPLNSTQGALFVGYCSACEDAIAETGHTIRRTTTRMGWHGPAFLRGTHQHGNCPQYQSTGGEGAAIAGTLTTGGDRQAWFDGVWPAITELPTLRAMVATSCAAPLLGIIECESFALDVCGTSSIGKTTAMEIVASVWGSRHYLQSWNNTRVAVERMAATCGDLPMLLDDTKVVEGYIAGKCVYEVVTGRGKGRGTITGMQETAKYKTLIISTGEGPLADTMTNAGGLRARCVTLWGSPLGESSRENAERAVQLKHAARHTYGHAGESLITWLVARTPEQRAYIRDRYIKEVSRLLDVCAHIESPVKARICEHVALSIIAGKCLEAALGMDPAIDWFTDRLFLHACAHSASADRALAAMDHALSWILTQPDAIYHEVNRRNDTPKRGQWLAKLKDDTLYIVPEPMERELSSKYTMSELLATWKERRWVEKTRVRVAGAMTSMFRIDQAALTACAVEIPKFDTDADEKSPY